MNVQPWQALSAWNEYCEAEANMALALAYGVDEDADHQALQTAKERYEALKEPA